MSDDPTPAASIEQLWQSAKDGTATTQELIEAFINMTVLAPSVTNPTEEAFQPLVFEIDGTPHMTVVDTLETAKTVSEYAHHAINLRGIDVVRGVAPGTAILMRMQSGGFAIDSDTIAKLREQFPVEG